MQREHWRNLNKKLVKKSIKIYKNLQKIKSNPYKFIEPLNRPKGAEPLYKLRIGEYRAIMAIRNNEMVILVVDIGHRKIIYRKYQ
ncbi:conserved hypothetical protein [Methanospirillum hungatei JF-1]|uniref:Plasmid stabilization system n=1 Tax=Methanospirillum hungatei JF-1 (strain ATCC 27890 / DSM 864 / NBRC 100397 / JF-1) TaxID=323259 RepID=Q2FM41_METHJ|nr:type II toxin-antitoxin system RelE/ParE family toxin [Methanospirillum hungatei]ABD41597.1 conserved hypothetical protein [Methanospirillum hungatei JF-1]